MSNGIAKEQAAKMQSLCSFALTPPYPPSLLPMRLLASCHACLLLPPLCLIDICGGIRILFASSFLWCLSLFPFCAHMSQYPRCPP